MLDQVFATRTVFEYRCLQIPGDVELMIAGEDDLGDLLLFITLRDQIPAQDLQPTFTSPHLFPYISRGMTLRIYRIAGAALIALIEWQKLRSRPFQLRRHVNFLVGYGEVDQCAVRK